MMQQKTQGNTYIALSIHDGLPQGYRSLNFSNNGIKVSTFGAQLTCLAYSCPA